MTLLVRGVYSNDPGVPRMISTIYSRPMSRLKNTITTHVLKTVVGEQVVPRALELDHPIPLPPPVDPELHVLKNVFAQFHHMPFTTTRL